MSHIFVLIALAAAMSEFLQARRLREEGRVAESAEIKVGLEGVAVKTSLFGVVLLITALGFYFLYLKFVYPIQFIKKNDDLNRSTTSFWLKNVNLYLNAMVSDFLRIASKQTLKWMPYTPHLFVPFAALMLWHRKLLCSVHHCTWR